MAPIKLSIRLSAMFRRRVWAVVVRTMGLLVRGLEQGMFSLTKLVLPSLNIPSVVVAALKLGLLVATKGTRVYLLCVPSVRKRLEMRVTGNEVDRKLNIVSQIKRGIVLTVRRRSELAPFRDRVVGPSYCTILVTGGSSTLDGRRVASSSYSSVLCGGPGVHRSGAPSAQSGP